MLRRCADAVFERLTESRGVHWFAYAGIDTIGLRARALIDLVLVMGVFELIVWVWRPAEWWLAVVLGAIVIGLVSVGVCVREISREIPTVIGRSTQAAWGLSILCTVGAAAMILGIAWSCDFLEQEWGWQAFDKPKQSLPGWFLRELGVVLFQQAGLQYVVFPLVTQIVGLQWAALIITGMIFSFLHLPNPLIMALTFVIAPLWCLLFVLGGRRLLPVMLSHAVLFSVIVYALPWHVTLGLAVGPKATPRLRMLIWLYDHDQLAQLRRFGSQAFYEEAGGTDDAFVGAVFRQIKGREPNDNEVTYLRAALSYHTRQQVTFELLAGHAAHGP